MISFSATNVRPEGVWRFLGPDDTFEADDLCRDLYPWSGSDYVDHDDFKRMNWATVKQVMPAWIGMTVRSFGERYQIEVIRRVPSSNHSISQEQVK